MGNQLARYFGYSSFRSYSTSGLVSTGMSDCLRMNIPTASTQPCIPSGIAKSSISFAVVNAGMSLLPGGRYLCVMSYDMRVWHAAVNCYTLFTLLTNTKYIQCTNCLPLPTTVLENITE